jgi:Ca2+/H+ antiporter
VCALFLLSMYVQLVVFQMITHRHLFEPGTEAPGGGGAEDELEEDEEEDEASEARNSRRRL